MNERLDCNIILLEAMIDYARNNPDLRIGQILQAFSFKISSEDFYVEPRVVLYDRCLPDVYGRN